MRERPGNRWLRRVFSVREGEGKGREGLLQHVTSSPRNANQCSGEGVCVRAKREREGGTRLLQAHTMQLESQSVSCLCPKTRVWNVYILDGLYVENCKRKAKTKLTGEGRGRVKVELVLAKKNLYRYWVIRGAFRPLWLFLYIASSRPKHFQLPFSRREQKQIQWYK